jgi:20S proteasome alpha/beta subunit
MGGPSELVLAAYDVCRNGPKLNSTPLIGTGYSDSTVVVGQAYSHYMTSVCDDEVQSNPSNTATITVSATTTKVKL